MRALSKRTTIYFHPALHRALRLKAATTNLSLSEQVNEALRVYLSEDQEDLQTFSNRIKEREISDDALLKDLKKHGKMKIRFQN